MGEMGRILYRFAAAFSLSVAAILVYGLLIVPGTLDYSHLAFIALLAGGGLAAYLLPRDLLYAHGMFILATLLLRVGLDALVVTAGIDRLLRSLVVVIVVVALARGFAGIRWERLVGMLLAALLLLALAPGHDIRAWSYFTIPQVSDRLYRAPVFDYFPSDVSEYADGPVRSTLGEPPGAADARAEDAPPPRPRVLLDEDVVTRRFVPRDGRLVEEAPAPTDRLAREGYYPAFPFYDLTAEGLHARTSMTGLVEGMLDFGRAPVRGLELARGAVLERLAQQDGVLDTHVLADGSRVSLLSGELVVEQPGGDVQRTPNDATAILGTMRTVDGEVVALLGRTLALMSLDEGHPKVTHRAGEEQFPGVHLGEYLLADVTGDGYDEILMSSIHVPSRILRPAPGGEWETLWAARADDLTFRFETVIDGEDEGDPPTLIVQRRSLVREHPLRYLTGYRLEGDTLQLDWRSLITLVDVHPMDVRGDGRPELVGTRYGEHRFVVLARHGWPVVSGLWALIALGAVYVLKRRHDRGMALIGSRPVLAISLALLLFASLGWARVAHDGSYPSAPHEADLSYRDRGAREATDGVDAADAIPEAIAASRAEDRFWYTGWVATYHGKRQINAMFDGMMHLPEGYVANVRINANPLRLFRWDDRLYSEERGIWRREGDAEHPLEPLGDFAWLEALAPGLEGPYEGAVLGVPARVYSGTIPMSEWLQAVGDAAGAADEGAKFMTQGRVEVEVLVDEGSGRLVEYRLGFEAPMPSVGWFRQETFFRLYRFGDPSIEGVPVEEIEEHIRRSPRD